MRKNLADGDLVEKVRVGDEAAPGADGPEVDVKDAIKVIPTCHFGKVQLRVTIWRHEGGDFAHDLEMAEEPAVRGSWLSRCQLASGVRLDKLTKFR